MCCVLLGPVGLLYWMLFYFLHARIDTALINRPVGICEPINTTLNIKKAKGLTDTLANTQQAAKCSAL